MSRSASIRRRQQEGVFSFELIEDRPGFALVRVTGSGGRTLFANESGGHRWQRVPPTEKHGRVHTSTVTVAVMPEPSERDLYINPDDIDETFTGGGGKGGQHQNKRSTTVVLVHKPSGIRVRIESRSQHANRVAAMAVLRTRLKVQQDTSSRRRHNERRQELLGSGMRGDKVRTVQVPNGVVVDHRTGKRMSFRRYKSGFLTELA